MRLSSAKPRDRKGGHQNREEGAPVILESFSIWLWCWMSAYIGDTHLHTSAWIHTGAHTHTLMHELAQVHTLALQFMNSHRCTPPFPDAEVQGNAGKQEWICDFINSNISAVLSQSCYQLGKWAHLPLYYSSNLCMNVLLPQLNKNKVALNNKYKWTKIASW